MNSWFSSKSSRHQKTPSNPATTSGHTRSGPSDASSVSQSTVGPIHTPGNPTSSDALLEEVHAHINDPSIYAPTPSLVHSTGKGTLRMSDVPPSLAATTQRCDVPIPESILFTPQDAIVAHVFGKSAPPATDATQSIPVPPSALQPSVSLTTRTTDSVPTPPSVQAPGPTLAIFDPFSGARVGEHTPGSPSTATPGDVSAAAPLPSANDRKLWSSLERILELQAEIAAMHADMEGVGRGSVNTTGMASVGVGEGRKVGSRRRSRRGQTLPVGDEEHEPEGDITGAAVSEASTEHSEGEADDEDDEDGDDVRGYGKRRRDEEFARLAEQFTQRKAAIGGIMNKLDALSIALKTFHTLPPPLFDLAASPTRTDTISSAPSNVSSPPPLHTYPGQLSPPFSSASPSHTGNPITPPKAPLSPPVPPVSTLAPLTASPDLNTSPGLAPIVPPVLPPIALPTIIPGAPRVESPADMSHPQSVPRAS